jgi:hypothetical protein
LSDRAKWKKPLGRPRLGWEDNIKVNNMKKYLRMWTGFIWLRTP